MAVPRLKSNAALRAALASGVPAEVVDAEADPVALNEEDKGKGDPGEDPATPPNPADEENPHIPPTDPPVAGDDGAKADAGLTAIVAQLTEAVTRAAKLESQVELMKAQQADAEGTNALARTIVQKAATRLSIYLNASLTVDESSSLQAWCQQFSKLDKDFEEKVPAVAMSRTSGKSDVQALNSAEDAEFKRRAKLVRKSK